MNTFNIHSASSKAQVRFLNTERELLRTDYAKSDEHNSKLERPVEKKWRGYQTAIVVIGASAVLWMSIAATITALL